MADEELGTGSIRIDLDDAGADASAAQLGARIERILDRASRAAGIHIERNINRAIDRINPATVRIDADTSRIQRAVNDLNNLGSSPIAITPEVDRARFEAAIQSVLDGIEVSVRVVPDLSGFDAAIRAHNAPTVRVNVDADRSGLSRLTGALGALGGALGGLGALAATTLRLGAMGIAAAGAAQGAISLVAALAPAAGIVAALPAAFLGAQVAMGTLKLATAGVGDAFKALASGDAAKLEKAMQNLSPAAKAAVNSIKDLAPELKKVQQGVQDSFFKQFGGDIKAAVTNLLPLGKGLNGIASEFGKAADQALKFGASKDASAGLKAVIDGTRGALSGLSTAVQPVLKGFLDVAASVSKAFGPGLGSAIGDTGARLGTFLSTLASSGRAVELVRGALAVFKQLGTIASNVGSILAGVFKAANDVGGGLLNNLAALTGQFKAFVQSAAGQEAIGNIFRTLSTVAAQLGPIISALVTQLGGIAPALAPLFTAIGPAIADLINGLGPALKAIVPGVQAVVEGLSTAISGIASSGALQAIGQAFGQVLTAVAPLLPVVGQLVSSLGTALAPVLSALASALGPVVTALADALAPILPPLTQAFTTLATALTPLITLIGTTLGSVIAAIAPTLAQLATTIAGIATAAAPLIVQLTESLVPVFQQLAPLVGALVAALLPLSAQLVTALLPSLPPIVDAFTGILNAVLPLVPAITGLVTSLTPFITQMLTATAPVLAFIAGIVSWLEINTVIPVIQNLVSTISTVLTAVTTVLTGISGFVSSAIGFFSNLSTSVSGIVSGMISAVVGFFSGLPGRATSAVSGITGSVGGVFSNLKTSVTSKVTSMVSTAITTLSGFVGRAQAAVSGASTALVQAGRDLIQGMINGVKSKAGDLASAAKSVVSGAVSGAKSLLGIHSPSKVFAEIGRFTGEGFIKGLIGTAASIKQAAEQVIGKIREAFKGKNSRLDDKLIAQVKDTQKRLLSLAKQRDAIAAKIKAANELAVSVTKNALATGALQNLAGRGGGVQGLTDGIDAAVTKIKTFNGQINALAKRGLRKDLLSQLIGLGPEQGAGLAKTLSSATGSQLADLNEAQKQLAAASKKLGKDSADNLFDAGKQASKGFLAGLKAQQKDVEDLMLSLARGMAKAIRSALGIHSPSKVFRTIGRFTMDGLDGGLKDRLGSVTRTARGAASAITDPFGGSGINVSGSRQAPGRGTGGRSVINNNSFIINQVSSEATVQQVMNRLAGAGALL